MSVHRFELRRDSSCAMYQQLADHLAEQIRTGRYKPFDRLPTEIELSRRFEVSRITVRQAIERLGAQNLVVRKQGKGTFVAAPAVRHDLSGRKGIIDELRSQGIDPEMTLLEFGAVEPAEPIRRRLGAAGELVRIRRLFSANGAPFAVTTTHLPPEAAELARETIESNPVYDILEQFLGIRIGRVDLAVRAEAAGQELAQILGTPARAPLLVFDRLSHDMAGAPCEHTLYWSRSENYEFSLQTQGPLSINSAMRRAG